MTKEMLLLGIGLNLAFIVHLRPVQLISHQKRKLSRQFSLAAAPPNALALSRSTTRFMTGAANNLEQP